jgi:hypothetical protein
MTTTRTFTYTVSFFDCATFAVEAPNKATAYLFAYRRYGEAYPKQWAAIIRVDRRVSLGTPKRRTRGDNSLAEVAPL